MTDVTATEARESCYQRFATGWGSRTPYAFANEKWDPPAGRSVRFSVVNTSSAQDSLGQAGNRRFLRRAAARAELFDDVDQGMKDLDEDVDAFRGIFEGVTFDGLRFFGQVTAQQIGPDGKGKYKVVCEAPFDYQEIK